MKRWVTLCVLIALMLPSLPTVVAQNDGCDINLEDTILSLVQAQRDADTGDTFAAVQTIDAIQTELLALSETCADVIFPLPKTFTTPDESLSFNYPDGWQFESPDTNIYVITTSEAAGNVLDGNETTMPPGEQVLFLFVADLDADFSDASSYDELVDSFLEDISDEFGSARAMGEPYMVNDHSTQRFRLQEQGLVGFFDFIDYTSEESNVVLVSGGFGATPEEDVLTAVVDAFEASIRYPANRSLREPGIALADLQYSEVIEIRDLNEDIDFRSATLAPDGSALAYFTGSNSEGQICRYFLETSLTDCINMPENRRVYPVYLKWSPNSQYIALTQDFFRRLDEADIWVYDIANQQMLNRTDDFIERWRFGEVDESDSTGPMWIDPIFAWGPDNNLYFMRWELPQVDADIDTATSGLYKLSPTEGEPELLYDTTGQFENFSTFSLNNFSLDGAIAVSPDAEQVAFLIYERERDSANNGVWVLADGQLTQVATNADLSQGLPSELLEQDSFFGLVPYALAWDEDGTGLYILADTAGARNGNYGLAYYADLDSGEVRPLIDVSNMTERDLFTVDEDTGRMGMFVMASAGVLAPDYSALLILNLGRPMGGVSILTSDGEQTLLFEVEELTPIPNLHADIAQDGTLLFFGNLFIPAK